MLHPPRPMVLLQTMPGKDGGQVWGIIGHDRRDRVEAKGTATDGLKMSLDSRGSGEHI